MQRLVYSPKAFVFTKDQSGRIRDLTRFVTAGTVSRKINQVSTAEVRLRNPNMIFTSPRTLGQAFLPMDPITIYLMRVKGKPVRVFTGFLDKAPFYEMYPGTITLTASCTLKKLLYTFFDPALPYTTQFLKQHGWLNEGSGQIVNPGAMSKQLPAPIKLTNTNLGSSFDTASQQAEAAANAKLTDSSIGNLLFATLKEIGGWHEDDIYIENLPNDLVKRMVGIYKKMQTGNDDAKREWEALMTQVIGTSSYGGGGAAGGGSGATMGGTVQGSADIVSTVEPIANAKGIPPELPLAVIYIESSMGTNMWTHDPYWGWYQINITGSRYSGPITKDQAKNLQYSSALFCTAAAQDAAAIPSLRNDIHAWAMKTQGVNCQNNPAYCSEWSAAMSNARELLSKFGKGAKNPSNVPAGWQQKDGPGNTVVRGGKDKASGPVPDVTNPAPGISADAAPTTGGGAYGAPRPYGHHAGVDVSMPANTPLVACVDGVVACDQSNWYQSTNGQGQGMISIRSDNAVGGYPKGTIFGYGHSDTHYVKTGDRVKAGQKVCLSGNPGGGPHLHFFISSPNQPNYGPCGNGNVNPTQFFKDAASGRQIQTTGSGSGSDSSNSGGGGTDNSQASATAAAFATSLEWPSIEESVEAVFLQGEKSLMNDKPLLPFVQQLTDASLRQFQSLPDGKFFAFYPDYFGEFFHRKPYWLIDDIEILDGRVELTDDALATHVYVVGDTIPDGQVTLIEKIMSGGVVTINDVFSADGIINKDGPGQTTDQPKGGEGTPTQLLNKAEALGFLKRYGARPDYLEEPLVRSPFFEAFLAYQRFMLLWSRQFLTTFTFTFMPELYPGGHVGFLAHGLQMYIDEVEHSWDYESGFTTQANLSAPAIMTDKNNKPMHGTMLPDNMILALNTDQRIVPVADHNKPHDTSSPPRHLIGPPAKGSPFGALVPPNFGLSTFGD